MYNISIGRWDFVRFNVLNASSFIPLEVYIILVNLFTRV